MECFEQPGGGEVRKPVEYATRAAAELELQSDPEFYRDCFVCSLDEIGHKTIFGIENQTEKGGAA
jgi:hypothetical protein